MTNRKLEHSEIDRALRFMYGPTGSSQIAGVEPIDFEYEISEFAGEYDKVMRFRCNATGCRVGAVSAGLSITMRTIPGIPPPWSEMNAPRDITDNFFPDYGLVLVIGTTGSGKSTLLASGNRHRLENPSKSIKLLTYEDPIEFVYTGTAGDRMPQPAQVQIGRDLKSFDIAGHNAMRRKGGAIVMGESRDRESVMACFEMALTGHAVYSTLHADTPAETFARMVSFFPEDSQPAAANKLLSTLKLIVGQKLEPRTDGSVQAVRSWLVIDREVKRRMNEQPFYKWGSVVESILTERANSFEAQCLPLVREGAFSFDSFKRITNMTSLESVNYFCMNDLVSAIPEEVAQDYAVEINRYQLAA
jgi:defect-in-organelle-trafficking protein DotB